MTEPNRKLAAIMSADVVGYSKLMADDEAATVETLQKYRAAVDRVIARHKGRIVNAPGDNILAEFPSAVEAVRAAVGVQKSVEGRNIELDESRRMQFRVGVNLGDVIEEADGTIYGDGVNIAARMEALADAGGICISSAVYDAVQGKIDFGFDFLGEQQVKNIDRAINVYRVRGEPGGTPRSAGPKLLKRRKSALIAGATLAIAVGTGLAISQFSGAPTPELSEVAEAPDAQPLDENVDPLLNLPQGPRIAVLPFENLSNDAAQDFFATGLTEDIINRLSRYSVLFVIARNSTAQYKGGAADTRRVAEDLDASYVVHGSVRKLGDRLRVSATVVEARTGTEAWAETYDRDLTTTDLFEIQDDITERVAAAIGDAWGIVLRADIAASKDKPPESLEAYECVLGLFAYYDAISSDEHARVRDCLERAIKTDPNYAPAWQALGMTYIDESRFGYNARPNSLDRALEAIQRAITLDPNNQYARHGKAEIYFARQELDAFFAEAARAIALNPSNATVLAALGEKMVWAGEVERGVAMVKKAASLNPRHPDWYYFSLGYEHFVRGDYQKALEIWLKVNMPGFFATHQWQAAAYGKLGQTEKAAQAIDRLLEIWPTYPTEIWGVLDAYNVPEDHIEDFRDGLRKGGLEISDRPVPTN